MPLKVYKYGHEPKEPEPIILMRKVEPTARGFIDAPRRQKGFAFTTYNVWTQVADTGTVGRDWKLYQGGLTLEDAKALVAACRKRGKTVMRLPYGNYP